MSAAPLPQGRHARRAAAGLTLAPLSVFRKELDKDIAGDTSGNFAKLLLALVQVASTLTLKLKLWADGRHGNHLSSASFPDQTRRTLQRDRLRDDRRRRQSEWRGGGSAPRAAR